VIAAAVLAAIPASVLQPLGVSAVSITTSAAAQGFAVGLLVSILFALVPLLEMRLVKPLLLLRADTATTARRADRASRLAALVTLAALVLVAVWQAGSVRAGLFVSGGLAVAWLLLLGVSHAVMRVTARLTQSRSFAVRHATLSLRRPGNQTRVVLMAVGLGCFFVMSVRAMQHNLLAEFSAQLGSSSPDLVLIDVQQDQTEGVQAAIAPYAVEPARIMPLMRARVVGVFGARTVLENADAVRKQGRLTREFGVTYRDALQSNERLVAGRFWAGAAPASAQAGDDAEVSISEEVRDDAGVGVGDTVKLDVGGQVVRARVTSIRHVAWDETQNGGFFFVLRPGPAVSRLPHAFVGFVRTGEDATRRAGLQRALVDGFPNVTVVDVRAVVASVRGVLDNITLGITVVGVVTLVSGALILIGAVAMTKFQRLYDAAIYRTLGAGTRLIATMVAVEYGLLGGLAGLVGAGGAFALSWALARYLFEIAWRPAPGLLAAGAVLTAILVSTIGLAASLDVLARKPLGALRSE
jgi:putative ABC transport system permease protein